MSWSIKLFKVKGIQIQVHLTFVLILVWAAYRWSGITGAGLQGALFGVIATLLLFAAVTLHELGHSFQAMKYNVKVRDITLMPMGGLARLEEMPEKPVQELKIALAGPLVNFSIAAGLIALGFVLQTRAVISLEELYSSFGQVGWSGMLAYLTMANLAIGAFNLLPAYPMDGGRVLRALLAMKLDYGRATAIAVRVGQGLAWMLGLYGFLSGSWTLVLIAILVWMGAGHEGRQVEAKQVLGELRVKQAMYKRPYRLQLGDSLNKAVELTLGTSQADFPVVQTGSDRVVGFLTEADLVKGLRAHGEAGLVDGVMHTRFPSARPEDALHQAQQQMAQNRMQAIPVVDDHGNLTGLLTASGINQAHQLLLLAPQSSNEVAGVPERSPAD
jgi:Zn-dependent protease/predicted transcriptional regulator